MFTSIFEKIPPVKTDNELIKIDDKLKAYIDDKKIAPDQETAKDLSSWLKHWTLFSLHALLDGYLRTSYADLFAEKIASKNLGIFANPQKTSFPSIFFAELLILCNRQFGWFDAKFLDITIIVKQIDNYLDDDSITDKEFKALRKLFLQYFNGGCVKWFENEIKKLTSPQELISYKIIVEIFLKACQLDIYNIFLCQTTIEKLLRSLGSLSVNPIEIKQNNCELFHQLLIHFLTSNNFSADYLQLCQNTNSVEKIIQNILPNIDADKEINRLYSNSIWRALAKDINQQGVSLVFNQHYSFTAEEKEKLLQLIATGKFAAIQISSENLQLFSFEQNKGILLNNNFLDEELAERIRLFLLLPCEINSFISFEIQSSSKNTLDRRLYRLATSVIEKRHDTEFSIDNNEVKFSQLGEAGINVYLSTLNELFVTQLRRNEIDRGYSLFIPKKDGEKTNLSLAVINGINNFLTKQFEINNDYIFCCQNLYIACDQNEKQTILSSSALAKLILLLDKAKLKQLTFRVGELAASDVENLSKTLRMVSNIIIRFQGSLTTEQAILFDSINDSQRQLKLDYAIHSKNEDKNIVLHDLSKQPSIISQAKIQALMVQEIHLQPIQSKIGFQNQHQVQQQTEQQTEVKILQSWQIEQAQVTKQESNFGTGILMGEEALSLINWQDIEAAFNSNHPNHKASQIKLGEEILNYQYKGRNLIDLWQRLTGNVKLTDQNTIHKEYGNYVYFSAFLLKQISYKALLTIVRHPHIFQDGVHLNSLPESFSFSRLEGALFIGTMFGKEQKSDQPNLLALQLSPIPRGSLPSAEHFYRLKESQLPSQQFFHYLNKYFSEYEAWQYWRRGFVALNQFNLKEIQTINLILEDCMQKKDCASTLIIEYLINALNFYHYISIAKQQNTLTESRTQFEYEQQDNYKHGVIDSLSSELMNKIPKELRELIHQNLASIVTKTNFTSQIVEDVYVQLIQTTMAYHQDKLPKEIKSIPFSTTEMLLKLLNIMGHSNSKKILELAISQDTSIVYIIFASLQKMYQVWGEIGLNDFIHCFLSPAINLATLAEPNQQEALRNLLQLNDAEYNWWQQLTLQHVEQSGYADFATLMQAFKYFLAELKPLGIRDSLPIPCPLQGINNLQVALNRVLVVIKQAAKPSEQLRNLIGLDWSVSGAVLASQEKKYQFISADMQLNLAFELKLQKLVQFYQKLDHYKVNPMIFSTAPDPDPSKDHQPLFEATLALFFRYIGAKKFTAPMLVYQQLLNEIVLPEKYVIIQKLNSIVRINDVLQKNLDYVVNPQPMILAALLRVIAYATTGRHNLDKLPQTQELRIKQLNRFIQAVYESSHQPSHDLEMDQFLNEINAVAYERIIEILDNCARLCSDRYSFEINENENKVYPDLEQLTTIIKLSKSTHDNYHKLDKNTWPEIRKQIEIYSNLTDKINQWVFNDYFDGFNFYVRSSLELLLEKYQQHFLEILNRVKQHNQKSDFGCILMAWMTIDNYKFSFENKVSLLRIISLLSLKLEAIIITVPKILHFLQQLVHYQEQSDTKTLDNLLAVLSCIIPSTTAIFNIEELITFVKNYILLSTSRSNININEFVLKIFKGWHLDQNLTEVTDADFYTDASLLENKFPGLGMFYDSIKSIILKKYPVLYGDNKLQEWQDFLATIHGLKNSQQQQKILYALLGANHLNIDLNTLNLWLSILLKQQVHRNKFPELFEALSTGLLKHSDRNHFIALLNDWLKFGDSRFNLESNIGFINILNKIATIPNGFSCLKNLYNTAISTALLSQHKNNHEPWHADFIKLIEVWQTKNLPIEELDNIFNCLEVFFKVITGKVSFTLSADIFLTWLKNITQTFDLTISIANELTKNNWPKIYSKMFILAQISDLDLNWVNQVLTEKSSDDLVKLAACYQEKPSPANQLLERFLTNKISLDEFISIHTSDPHNERDESKLRQQFDNDALWVYYNRAKYLKPHQVISLDFGEKFHAQIKFVNHLGYEQFRFWSLNDICKKLHDCRGWVAKTTDKQEELMALLTAFGLVREAIYKTSLSSAILWPSTVQTLAILSALNHELDSKKASQYTALFMQMATGEGKSLLAVFLAILMWIKGDPVTVATHRASLGARDANVYTRLFQSLNIECEHFTADSYLRYAATKQIMLSIDKQQKPELSGIYYIEFNDLALIHQQRLLNSGLAIPQMSFIIDEADELILHNQTDNNLTQNCSAEDVHPHAWVFEELAGYLENQNVQKDTLSVQIRDVIDYLQKVYPLAVKVCQQVEFIIKLPIYLQAAWQARILKEKVDFIPKVKNIKDNSYYAAILLNDKPMSPSVTFNGLVQQALHGLLNYQAKKQNVPRRFVIAPETKLFSSMSPEATLRWMMKIGNVIAVSATIGSSSELKEMQQNFNFDFIKLPKMQSSLRVDYPVQFCTNQPQQLHVIAEICKHYTTQRTQYKSRALLVVVESIEFAEKLNQYLCKQFSTAILHGGLENISDDLVISFENQAGQSNHILISVAGFTSRGFDILLSTASQVVVIHTYLKNYVDEIQVKGRASRVHRATGVRDKGKFYEVYDLEKECNRYPGLKINLDNIDLNPEAVKQQLYFAHYQQESALRLHRQLVSVTKNAIREHFYKIWMVLFSDNNVLKDMRDEVMNIFTNAFEKITTNVPTQDFTIVTEIGASSRNTFNKNLLIIYEEALVKIKSIFRETFTEDVVDIIAKLTTHVEKEQQQLLANLNQALATGADKPSIKIYKQWKKGVKFNAYVDHGKQSNSNYVVDKFSAWWNLSKENKQKLVEGKNQLTKKITLRKDHNTDFISQLNHMMTVSNHQDLFMHLLKIYEQKSGLSQTLLADKQKYDTVVVDYNNILSTSKKLKNNRGEISFIYDPFVDKACQISLISDSLEVFQSLQTAINEAYKLYNIAAHLKFHIVTISQQVPRSYQVVIDFSSHAFDSVNRKQLLETVAKTFDIDLQQLTLVTYIPTIDIMQKLLNDLGVASLFKNTEFNSKRVEYYRNIFLPALEPLKQYVEELCYYHLPFCYRDLSGKKCESYPPCFKDLAGLVENHRKREALTVIDEHTKIFAKQQGDSFLYRQQAECFVNLSLAIVNSKAEVSLQTVYEKWRALIIQYQQQKLTVAALMKMRDKKTSLFITTQSPEVNVLCEKIEAIMKNNENAQENSNTLLT